jgi:hypothetical protein
MVPGGWEEMLRRVQFLRRFHIAKGQGRYKDVRRVHALHTG